jgi:hypothetical protein
MLKDFVDSISAILSESVGRASNFDQAQFANDSYSWEGITLASTLLFGIKSARSSYHPEIILAEHL